MLPYRLITLVPGSMRSTMTYILAITTVATLDDAKQLAHILVQEKLCACVNILSKCCSIYSWQGNIEETEEHILLIKTMLV